MATKQAGFNGIIEEPSSFATLATWERHLEKIKAIDFAPDAIPSKAMMLRTARDTIAWKKRLLREFNAGKPSEPR